MPTLDVTYVSDALRVSRGGDGSLFVLERAADEGFGELEEPGEDVVESKKDLMGLRARSRMSEEVGRAIRACARCVRCDGRPHEACEVTVIDCSSALKIIYSYS